MIWLLPAPVVTAADLFVAVNGADTNPGTKDFPLATLAKALRKARELRRLNDPSIENGIHIILQGGLYQLYEPVFIRPEDAGTAKSPTFIEAAPGEQPVLSGGIQINHWKKSVKHVPGLPAIAQGKVWMADVPLNGGSLSNFRQLWINDNKAIRAKSSNGNLMNRILSWNKKDKTCWIPAQNLKDIEKATGVEMFIHQWWEIANLRIKKIERQADSAKLFFYEPESTIQSEHPWPAPWISAETGNSAFYLTNAIQFLDEPGEWWLDVPRHTLYYWPRSNEKMYQAIVTAPLLETLLTVKGTKEKPVSNIFFNGISFEHTGWLRPSLYGHVPHQAGMYMLDAYKLTVPGTPGKKTLENQAWVGRPAAAVQISYADNTAFNNCRFEHLAATGVDYAVYTHQDSLTGNLFKDIGGSGILAGVFSDEAAEVHIPYNPSEENEICSGLSIRNNLVTDAANEDWGCVGIGAGYVRNIQVEHNEISDVAYTGISIGWGWSKTANAMKNNQITFNKINHYGKHNYDCAGVYTLSAQPGTIISNNYIDSIYKAPYAHLPNHWFYLYTDEGSSFITVKDNWCPAAKFLQNANGPGNEWINNGPQAGEKIKQMAGIELLNQYLLKEKTIEKNISINQSHPVLLELIAVTGTMPAKQSIEDFLSGQNIQGGLLYQWKSHYVVFGHVADAYSLRQKMKANFPSLELKMYDVPFYVFDRSHCRDTATAKEWQHIILTANLVKDQRMQNEYLNYHANQFRDWPEVAQGFCNAGFQRLLVYKNGRQLMLVISIPKGESLDKLNPRTTADNPRMDDWNKQMKKYQEGIEGTIKGETWVFFQPVQ